MHLVGMKGLKWHGKAQNETDTEWNSNFHLSVCHSNSVLISGDTCNNGPVARKVKNFNENFNCA